MKKFFIIALLAFTMSIFAQSNQEFIYQPDEIGFLTHDYGENWKETSVSSNIEDSPFNIIMTEHKVIVLSGMDPPLLLKINSRFKTNQSSQELRCVDIQGNTVKILLNTSDNNIFMFLKEKEGVRFHIKVNYNTDIRKFTPEEEYKL